MTAYKNSSAMTIDYNNRMKLAKQGIIVLLIAIILAPAGCKPKKTEMPQVHNSSNIYADTNAGMFAEAVRSALPRVYVPNSEDNTVSVIDPSTYQVIDTFATGKNPQHVVPAYDLKTIWVLNNKGNSVYPYRS